MTQTKQQTIDTAELEQRAARAAEAAAEASAALAARHAEADRRQRERQAAYDQQVVDAYDRRTLDEAVDRCRADLERTVAESPITVAAAKLLSAEVNRYVAHCDLLAALSRAGRPTAGQSPMSAHVADVAELAARTAERLAHDEHEQHLERTRQQLADPTGDTP